jgi:hypothetical protein
MVTTARRVLVIGRVPAVNQRVVEQIAGRGHVAVGAAGEGSFPELDAREHDVVAIGSGVDPETRAALKQRFRAQHREVLLLDVYGPLAAEQVVAALREVDGVPSVLAGVTVEEAGEVWRVGVEVRQVCRLRVDVFRHRGSPVPEVVAIAEVTAGPGVQRFAVAREFTGAGHMLVVRVDEDELEVVRLFAG